MTLHDAIRALLIDYELPQWVDLIRDEVKGDPQWDGLSQDHPRVQRFKDICAVFRAELAK